MKRILVTGGAGYIGSVLVPLLIAKGYEVKVIDKGYFGDNHLRAVAPKVQILRRDIRSVTNADLNGAEAIIHLAALSNDPMANFAPDLNYEINTEATMRLARLAKKIGVRKFIFASSCSIYHLGYKNHILHRETDKVFPKEYYSHSKYLAEQAILPLAGENFSVTVLRKGTVGGYSPRMRFDLVVNTMVKTAITRGKLVIFDGTQQRPIVDARDAATAYWKLLQASDKKVNGQIFNLSYKNYTILKLATEIKRTVENFLSAEVPLEIKKRIRDRTYRVSGQKLNKTLQMRPRFSVVDSTKTLLAYLREQNNFDFLKPQYYNIEQMKKLFPGLK